MSGEAGIGTMIFSVAFVVVVGTVYVCVLVRFVSGYWPWER